MKLINRLLACVLALQLTAAPVMAVDLTTPNLGLTKPATVAGSWGEDLNLNFDLIDAAVGAAQGGLAHLGANQTFTGANTFSGSLVPPSAFFSSLTFFSNSLWF